MTDSIVQVFDCPAKNQYTISDTSSSVVNDQSGILSRKVEPMHESWLDLFAIYDARPRNTYLF